MRDCPACQRALELQMTPALCANHINAWRVEEACRRWWDSRGDLISWEQFSRENKEEEHNKADEYRLRMAAALEIEP